MQNEANRPGGAAPPTDSVLRQRPSTFVATSADGTATGEPSGEQTGLAPLRQADGALGHARDRAQVSLDTVETMVVALDVEGRITAINRKGRQLLGWSEDELIGQFWFSFCLPQPDGVEEAYRCFQTLMAGDMAGTEYFGNPILTRSGELRQIAWHNALLRDDHDRIIGTVSAGDDITERERTEAALRASQQLIEGILDAIPVRVFWKDTNLVYLGCNGPFARDAGFAEPKDVIGKDDYQMGWRDQAELYRRDDRQVIESDRPKVLIEEPLTTVEGNLRTLLTSKVPLRSVEGEVIGVLGTYMDITERKRAEVALRESEQYTRLLLDSIAEGFYGVDTLGNCILVNRACLRMLGYDKEAEVLGQHIHELIHHTRPDGTPYPEGECRMYEALRIGGTTDHVDDEVFWRRDGTSFPVEYSSYPILRNGQLVGAVASFFDITGKKQAEESHARLETAVEQSAESVMITDVNAAILYVNSAFEQTSGYAREEVIGRNPRMLMSGKHDAEFYRHMWTVLNRGDVWSGHLINKRKDGTLYEEHVTISAVRNAAGETINYVAVKRDVTRESRLEAQLRQAQKMESVGRLAGGVAHDFNNMLGVILGHAELALGQVDPANPLHGDLQQIREAAERSADLTRQLLAFARKQTVAPKILDLSDTVAGMLNMLRRLIGEDINLRWRPEEGLWKISVDPSQLDQILANLCVNARDAISGVGTITIETGNRTLREDDCAALVGCVPGDYVLLTISDDGCGMDHETLSHLFEPFFTTKAMGKGTGLGLSMVYGIVKQNEGFIDVRSQPNQGTTFRIYLPRHVGKTGQARTKDPARPASRGQGTILVVEDEPILLSLTKRMLEHQGYTVLAASTPGDAMRLAREHTGDINLLITDVIMPEMNGRTMAKNLLSLYPLAKRLFMSGYTADVIAHRGVLDEGVNFIQKPFSREQLVTKVREVLDALE